MAGQSRKRPATKPSWHEPGNINPGLDCCLVGVAGGGTKIMAKVFGCHDDMSGGHRAAFVRLFCQRVFNPGWERRLPARLARLLYFGKTGTLAVGAAGNGGL